MPEPEPKQDSAPRLFFSILVCGRNVGSFVEPCLRSVLAQTFPSWECLVLDDASTDNTYEEIKRVVAADLRFRLFRTTERQTALPNLMRLIREAKGDYVFILDLDDWLKHEHVLDIVFRVYEDASTVIATSGSYERFPDGGRGHCQPVPAGADWFSGWYFGHPLTWERRLSLESFAEEPEAYLDINTGKPYDITYDLALFFPVAARAEWEGKSIAHIRDPLRLPPPRGL